MHQKPSVILAVIEAQILINVPFGKYRTNVYLAREMVFFPGSCPANGPENAQHSRSAWRHRCIILSCKLRFTIIQCVERICHVAKFVSTRHAWGYGAVRECLSKSTVSRRG
jgi:hypothetical protein